MRIIKEVEIEGKGTEALFDIESFHPSVTRRLLGGVPLRRMLEPYKVALGGRTIVVKDYCSIRRREFTEY